MLAGFFGFLAPYVGAIWLALLATASAQDLGRSKIVPFVFGLSWLWWLGPSIGVVETTGLLVRLWNVALLDSLITALVFSLVLKPSTALAPLAGAAAVALIDLVLPPEVAKEYGFPVAVVLWNTVVWLILKRLCPRPGRARTDTSAGAATPPSIDKET